MFLRNIGTLTSLANHPASHSKRVYGPSVNLDLKKGFKKIVYSFCLVLTDCRTIKIYKSCIKLNTFNKLHHFYIVYRLISTLSLVTVVCTK
jgi:hypothetical protein